MTKIKDIPIVTLKDMVVYPRGVQPLFIGTEKSIRALEIAQESDGENTILLVAKIDPNNTDPCLLYTSPSPRDLSTSRMPSSA